MVDKINPVGFTNLRHYPILDDNKVLFEIKGMPKDVFEKFGKRIIESDSDCSEEIFKILALKMGKYGDEKLKQQWVEFSKKFIEYNKLDLSDELHELMTFHYARLDFKGQFEMILRYIGKDTIFSFRKIGEKQGES